MSILGALIDKTTVSRAGDDLSGVTLGATLAHSLPATNPEAVLPIVRSVEEIGAQPPIQVLGLGGNASLATLGYVTASTTSAPTVLFDVYSIVFHSIIR